MEPKYEQLSTDALLQNIGAPTEEGPEVHTLSHNLQLEADRLCSTLEKEVGVSTDETARVRQTWQGAVYMGRKSFTNYCFQLSQPWYLALAILNRQRDQYSAAAIADMGKVFKQAIAYDKGIPTRAYALMHGSQTLGLPAEQESLQVALRKLFVINYYLIQKRAISPAAQRVIVYEETMHMLSKLKTYGPQVSRVWVEELMARVIAYRIPGGYAEWESRHKAIATRMLRLDSYLRLYSYLDGHGVRAEALPSLFWGKLAADDPVVSTTRVALGETDDLGRLVNSGAQRELTSKLISYLAQTRR